MRHAVSARCNHRMASGWASAQASSTLGLTRLGYFGSIASAWRTQLRTVFRNRTLRLAISRSGTFPRKWSVRGE